MNEFDNNKPFLEPDNTSGSTPFETTQNNSFPDSHHQYTSTDSMNGGTTMSENFRTADNQIPPCGYTPNTVYGTYSGGSPKNNNNKYNRQKHLNLPTIFLSLLLSLVVSLSSSAVAIKYFSSPVNDSSSETTPPESSSQPSQSEGSQSITIQGSAESVAEAVYAKSYPSVVGIRTTISVKNFFNGTSEEQGEGSGVVYTQDGYIITNYHVVSDSSSHSSNTTAIEVFFIDEPDKPIKATLVGYNVSADLAVLKIDRSDLTPISIGNSDSLKVGQNVVAIGCPGGIDFIGSVSNGIVSGLNRTITVESLGEMQLIQTDTAINPGNSGGALLDSTGNLVGITSSKLVDESFEGMGFAIPVNSALEVVRDIIDNEDNPSPYMGIEIFLYSGNYLESLGLPAGAAVKSVVNGAPAESAGIRAGDIIVQFNGTAVKEYTDFSDLLNLCKPGQRVTIKLYRNGAYYQTNITIGSNNGRG